MPENRTPARPAAALIVMAVAIVAGTFAAAPDADSRPARPSVACPTEDSTWCVRDARHSGNGQGRSYWVDRSSVPHFVSHATAHRMIRAGR